jgi:hypothetical protein
MGQHLDRYRPADDVELSVVEEMASAFWRLRRLWAIETNLFDEAISTRQPGDEIGRTSSKPTFRMRAATVSPESARSTWPEC